MENEELSADEIKSLQLPKRRKTSSATPIKEIVSPEEYNRRLQASLKQDSLLVSENRQKRIDRAALDWKKKVGSRFADASTDNPRILERVARLARGEGHKTSLILPGSLGVGKTWNAYAYINAAIAAGAVTAGQIIADTETAVVGKISSGGYKRSEMLEELFNPKYKIYFIDDVGQGYFSSEQGRREVWYEIMDHVYSHDLTLILTTNKEFKIVNGVLSGSPDLEKWLGPAAYDRMRHIVGPDGVIIPGNVNKRPGVFESRETKSK